MHDVTVSGISGVRETAHAIPRVRCPDGAASHIHDDDENLARLLITSWTLITGRTLRGDVSPHMLSADELISFWADEQMAADPVPPANRVSDCHWAG